MNLRISDKDFRWPVVGFLILWMGFHIWTLQQYFNFSWNIAIWDAIIYTISLVSAAITSAYVIRFLPKSGILQMTVVTSVVLAFIVQWISHQALISLFEEDSVYISFLQQSIPIRWAIAIILITSSGLISNFYHLWKETENAHEREQSTQIMVRDAELQKLQLQLQPHFLFNSLNSINALIITNPEKAGTMVQQLSDFLRATIKRADEKWITMAQEFDYLQLYLSIEKVRFGHRLEVTMKLDEQIQLWLIPPLLLQPLVENAIKFGLYGTTGQVVINLHTQREGNSLSIEISNPFDKDMQPAEGSGFGLNGLRRRLYLLYARNDLLATRVEEDKFIVRLLLPEKYD